MALRHETAEVARLTCNDILSRQDMAVMLGMVLLFFWQTSLREIYLVE
ncbi:MAG: hypothetical protein ACMUJM_24400 [bacterium]